MCKLKRQGIYNFKNQDERLIYLGEHCNSAGDGYWHQFAKVDRPEIVWTELRSADLDMIEETLNT